MKFQAPSVAVLMACVAALLVTAPARAAVTAPARPRPAVAKSVLPFIHDDYAKAVSLARARKVPLFIEAWAPW